jgi:hypothetical protein
VQRLACRSLVRDAATGWSAVSRANAERLERHKQTAAQGAAVGGRLLTFEARSATKHRADSPLCLASAGLPGEAICGEIRTRKTAEPLMSSDMVLRYIPGS